VGPFDFYPETEWRDDLELGATELYFALRGATNLPPGLPHTDPTYYLQKAATWANAYITGPNDAADTLNLYDVSGLAHFELYRAIVLAGNPSGLATSEAALLADLKKQLDKAVTQAGKDPFGFGFPWNTYDTNIARRRPGDHGQRVRQPDQFDGLCRVREPLASQRAGGERLGYVANSW
jgi:endoglucanase